MLTRQPQWNRQIHVGDDTFVRIIQYLADSQQLTTSTPPVDARLSGSWNVSGVIDRRFSPRINESKWTDPVVREAHRRVPSAAMVLVALRSTGRSLPSGIPTKTVETMVSAAVTFLKQHVLQVDDLFSIMIAAYGLRVASDSSTDDVTK